MGACVGATCAEQRGDKRQLIGEAASLFKRVFPLLLIGGFVCFAGRVAVLGASDSGSTAVIAWT